MKKFEFNGEEFNISNILKLEEDLVFRKVTPEFFTHDEVIYHINSIAALNIDYIDHNDNKQSKEIVVHKEYMKESFGWELEYDVYDYIECVKETSEFKEARTKVEGFVKKLKEEFNFN